MTKTNNKGFSLVELIIVIAIMAILIGVLAPQYIKYVEKSRVSSDEDMIDSITKAVQIACTDEDYYASIVKDDSVVINNSTTPAITVSSNLTNVIKEYYGDLANKKLKSKEYSGATITIKVAELTNPAGTVTGLTAEVTITGAQTKNTP